MKTDNCSSYSAMEVGLSSLPPICKELQTAPVDKSFVNVKVSNELQLEKVKTSANFDANTASVHNGFSALSDNSVRNMQKAPIEKIESEQLKLGNGLSSNTTQVNITKNGKTGIRDDDNVTVKSSCSSSEVQMPMEVEENVEKMDVDSDEKIHKENIGMDIDDIYSPTKVSDNSRPQESIVNFNESEPGSITTTRLPQTIRSDAEQKSHCNKPTVSPNEERINIEKISSLIEELGKSPAEKSAKPQAEESAKPQAEELGKSKMFPAEESIKSPVEESIKSPVEESIKFLVEESIKSLVEESIKSPAEESTKSPAEESTKSPAEESTKSPAEEPTKSPAEESTKSPAEESTKSPAEESTKSPSEESTKSSAEESTKSPAEKSTKSPADESVKSPADESVKFTVKESVKSPAEQSVKSPGEESVKSPAEVSVKSPAEESSKSSADESSKSSAEESSQTSAEKSCKFPAEDSSKSSADESSKSSADESSKFPVEKSSKFPAEESSKFTAEESSKFIEEKSRKSPAEESSKSPAEESSKSPAEESSKSPAEESSKSPAEESRKSPAEESRKSPAEESRKSPAEESSKSPAEESSKSPAEESSKSPAEESSKSPIINESDEDSKESSNWENTDSESDISKHSSSNKKKVSDSSNEKMVSTNVKVHSKENLSDECTKSDSETKSFSPIAISKERSENEPYKIVPSVKKFDPSKSVDDSDDDKSSTKSLKFTIVRDTSPLSDSSTYCNAGWDVGENSNSSDSTTARVKTFGDLEKVKYSFRNRCESARISKQWKNSLGTKNKKHDFDFDDLVEAIQDIAENDYTIRKAAHLYCIPYSRVYSFVKSMMAVGSPDDVINHHDDDLYIEVDDSTSLPISANNSPATFDIFSSQQTMLAGITETKKMPSVSPSPMINIPAGVVKEFLSDSLDDEICKNLNNNSNKETVKPNGIDVQAKDATEELSTKLIPSESLLNGKTSHESTTPVNLDENVSSPKFTELSNMVVDSTPIGATLNDSVGGTKRSLSGEDLNEDFKKPRLSNDNELKSLKIDDKDEDSDLKNNLKDCADVKVGEKDAKRKFDDVEVEDEVKKIRKLSRKLHKMPRKDLENSIVELFINKLLYNHQLGEYKTLVEKLENNLETSRKKAKQFHKELDDLRKVTKRLQDEHVARKDHIVTPIKIKRSVGIQASPQIIQKGVVGAQTNPVSVPVTVTYKSISPRMTNNAITLHNSIANTTILNNTTGSVVQSGLANKNPIMLLNTSNGTRHYVPLPIQQNVQNNGNKPYLNALMQNKAMNHQTSPSSNIVKSNQGVIDLTDEEENNRNMNSISKSTLVNQASSAISSGFVALSQASGVSTPTQYVLVPNGSVSGAAVMVANVNHQAASNSAGLQNVSTTSTPTRLLAIPSSSILQNGSPGTQQVKLVSQNSMMHPAELPRTAPQQVVGSAKQLPSIPTLKLSHKENSIVLSWTMNKTPDTEAIASYQLYAYQESSAPPSPSLWKKVGSVKALELPMACTLTQFMPGHRYHFAVRAVDVKCRLGPFSDPKSINLVKKLFP